VVTSVERRPAATVPPPSTPAVRGVAVAVAVAVAALVVAAVSPRGLPAGVVANGVVGGSAIALASIAIVVVHRSSRILDLAQGQLGALGAAVALAVDSRWPAVPWVVAAAAGLGAAVLTGAAVHLGVFRRLGEPSPVVAVVATIGVAELVGGGARLLGPLIDGVDRAEARPSGPVLHLDPVVLTVDHLTLVLVAFGLTGAVAWVLRSTRAGRWLRAAGANPRRARGMGVPVDAVRAAAWATAAALSAAVVLLQVPLLGLRGPDALLGGGSALLLRALAAAILGGMREPWRVAAAAVGVGVADQVLTWSTGNTTVADLALVGAIVVGLHWQARSGERLDARAAGSARSIRRSEPSSSPHAGLPATAVTVTVLVGVALAIAVAAFAGPFLLRGLSLVLVAGILALSVVVVSGWTGHVSLGQAAFAGLGAGVTALLFGRAGVDLFVSAAIGCSVAGAASVAAGLPALRRGGPMMAVSTLGLALACSSSLFQIRHAPWFVTEAVARPVVWGRIALDSDRGVCLLCVLAAAAAVVVVRNLERSRIRRLAVAVADNRPAAAAAGVAVVAAEVRALALSGALAGLAGALLVVVQRGFDSGSFVPEAGIAALAMAAVGGLSSPIGAFGGAFLLRGSDLLLSPAWSAIASGAGMLCILLWFPAGLAGLAGLGRRR
jgi:branched-chain amino acid transport system permease protein